MEEVSMITPNENDSFDLEASILFLTVGGTAPLYYLPDV
jgi:hypothetical protein